ncbi:MAG: glycoside hydrolase N-terminal domain-containing protein [Ferruginibacter sp.]
MKKLSIYILVVLLLQLKTVAQNQPLKLWYDKPAVVWTDALPIGNGNMGAMIFGAVNEERIQFNHSTLWTGWPRDYQRNDAWKYLPQIRKLLSEGKQADAESLAEQHFMGLKDVDDSVYEKQKKEWQKKVTADVTPFTSISIDDSHWKEMKLPTPNGWETAGLEGVDGSVWFRNYFELPKEWTGKKLVVDLGRIRDEDHTYINGMLIGSSEGISKKRSYIIDAGTLKEGKNVIAIQVLNYFDKGGFTGIKENRKIFVVYPQGETADKGIVFSSTWKYKIQNDNPPAFPQYEASYQPFGDVFFKTNTNDISNYKRELDISNAISKVSYNADGINFTREYFASNPQKFIAIHFSANKNASINLTAFYKSLHTDYIVKKIDPQTIALYVKVKNGALKGTSYLHVEALHGIVNMDADTLIIKSADELTFYLIAATNFKNYKDVSADPDIICKTILKKIKDKTYQEIKKQHIKDYQDQFNNFSIGLGKDKNEDIPTDERIKQFNINNDPSLLSLYVQYARYLMIASSRTNSIQPPNLQGIWNDLLTPPWGSKYTTNINLEMNYWPSEELNLSNSTMPLFNMINDLKEAGKLTARAHYRASGWVLHHNTDIWRGTAPINASNHGIWVSGAAWLCHHVWEHYLFTQDKMFLQKNYPAMKSAAEFFVDFLTKDKTTGWLISTPSNSPENGGLVAGPTMDHQIIRDLFKNCIAAAAILKTDEAFSQILKEKYLQIAPNQVGKFNQLQEWLQDKDDTTNTHRHVSHLWGVYPGTDISWSDPKMMNAAKQSLLYRGDDGTGWSLAWKTNLWARFKDGNHAMKLLEKLLSAAPEDGVGERGGVYKNMFDAHPPFQIDGNFGGAAAVAEMLLQSQDKFIELLPALPSALPEGEIKGICARGGFVISMKWNGGKLQQASVTSTSGNECHLKYKDKALNFSTINGKTYQLNNDLQLLK